MEVVESVAIALICLLQVGLFGLPKYLQSVSVLPSRVTNFVQMGCQGYPRCPTHLLFIGASARKFVRFKVQDGLRCLSPAGFAFRAAAVAAVAAFWPHVQAVGALLHCDLAN